MRLCFLGTLVLLISWTGISPAPAASDRIVGRWISVQGNVIVDVFKDSLTYEGKVDWFDDSDDPAHPMYNRTDAHNPDLSLRGRKIIGLTVLEGLTYNPKSNSWENGKIYDVNTGKVWSSTIHLENDSLLKIRGFWHFEILGKTMTFKRL